MRAGLLVMREDIGWLVNELMGDLRICNKKKKRGLRKREMREAKMGGREEEKVEWERKGSERNGRGQSREYLSNNLSRM